MPLQKGQPVLRVHFKQSISKADYIQHLYSVFYPFVGTPPRVRKIRGGGARDRQSIEFKTYSHPEFKFYDDLFYPLLRYPEGGRKKRVPENIH